MAVNFSLTQVQSLKLVMTPELRQSIEMLQLSTYELLQYLQEQAVENPWLDVSSEGDFFRTKKKSSNNHSVIQDRFWNVESKQETLEQKLIAQLRLMPLSSPILQTASYLAGNLNEKGYLSTSLEDASLYLNQPLALVEEALATVQSLDPPGVGARDLQECLLIQMKRDAPIDPKAFLVVSQYLKELAQGKFHVISEALHITSDEVHQILQYIRTLNPRPGLSFSTEGQQYIIPDAVIEEGEAGYVLRMNEKHLPKVNLNPDYLHWMEASKHTEALSYLKNKWRDAQWIIRSIEQRKQTITRVTEAIIEEQHAFLEKGVRGIRPLNLKIIAEKLELHESTISRAVQNKHIRTPHGIFELKFFFAVGLKKADGDVTSNTIVKERVKELIGKEDRKHPLSDQKIAQQLTKEGIVISRRTIAKYRDEMNILSSSMRKLMV